MKKKLRVGVLMDSLTVEAWEWALLERIRSSRYAEIALVVLSRDGRRDDSLLATKQRKNAPRRLVANLLQRAYQFLERNFRCDPDAFSTLDAQNLLAGVARIEVVPLEAAGDVLTEEDQEQIESARLDVLVQLGFPQLKGGILKGAKYGVWALRQAEHRLDCHALVAFWEVYLDKPEIESSVHVLSDDATSTVISRSFSATNRISIKLTKNNLYWKTVSLVPRSLQKLHQIGPEAFFKDMVRAKDNVTRRSPTNVQLALNILRNMERRARNFLIRRFTIEQWILLFKLGLNDSTNMRTYRKIVPPRDRYWADPHVVEQNDKYYVFFEELPFDSNRGHIAVLAIDKEGNYGPPVSVLRRDYHLSYPFVFEHAGDLFMVPESAANRTIELYRCVDFPERWEFVENLLQDIYAVDSTLLQHNGKWWLFSNVVENAGASSCEELFLFYSESLLGGLWVPHPLNPIVSDVRRARPAGPIFRKTNRLYRPAQDCSIRYGYGVRVHEITALSEHEYAEAEVQFIQPNWDKAIVATHTLSKAVGLTMIDALQRRFTVRPNVMGADR